MHKMPRIWLEYLVSLNTSESCRIMLQEVVNSAPWSQQGAELSGLLLTIMLCRYLKVLCPSPLMKLCCNEYLLAAMQEFMVSQGLVTRTRRAFDRALCALPITQHERIWQIYLVSSDTAFMSILALIALGWHAVLSEDAIIIICSYTHSPCYHWTGRAMTIIVFLNPIFLRLSCAEVSDAAGHPSGYRSACV